MRSTSSPRRRWSTLSRLKIFGSTPVRALLVRMTASIAVSMSSPMPSALAFADRYDQRASAGTQNTPCPVYSSMSSRNWSSRVSAMPWSSTSRRIWSRRSSKESETYLRNTRPRTKSLYWAASMEPRSLSAAFHSVSRRSAIVGTPGSAVWPLAFFLGGMVLLVEFFLRVVRCDGQCAVSDPGNRGVAQRVHDVDLRLGASSPLVEVGQQFVERLNLVGFESDDLQLVESSGAQRAWSTAMWDGRDQRGEDSRRQPSPIAVDPQCDGRVLGDAEAVDIDVRLEGWRHRDDHVSGLGEANMRVALGEQEAIDHALLWGPLTAEFGGSDDAMVTVAGDVFGSDTRALESLDVLLPDERADRDRRARVRVPCGDLGANRRGTRALILLDEPGLQIEQPGDSRVPQGVGLG